jgi:hypothetical protein
MNTIKIGRTTYKLRDTSTIFADHAKCTGKHKIVKSKGGEKRLFPKSGERMSTADYVNSYQVANDNLKFKVWDWQALTEHVSQVQGEDTFEVEA